MSRSDLMKGIRSGIAADLRKVPTEVEVRVAKVREGLQSYVDGLTARNLMLTEREAVLEAEIDRQERNLRVLSATASQHNLVLIADMVLRAQQGARL